MGLLDSNPVLDKGLSPPFVPPTSGMAGERNAMLSTVEESGGNVSLGLSGFVADNERTLAAHDQKLDLMVKTLSNTFNSQGGRLKPVPEQEIMADAAAEGGDLTATRPNYNPRNRRGSGLSNGRMSTAGSEFSFHMGGGQDVSADHEGVGTPPDSATASAAANALMADDRRSWDKAYVPVSPHVNPESPRGSRHVSHAMSDRPSPLYTSPPDQPSSQLPEAQRVTSTDDLSKSQNKASLKSFAPSLSIILSYAN